MTTLDLKRELNSYKSLKRKKETELMLIETKIDELNEQIKKCADHEIAADTTTN